MLTFTGKNGLDPLALHAHLRSLSRKPKRRLRRLRKIGDSKHSMTPARQVRRTIPAQLCCLQLPAKACYSLVMLVYRRCRRRSRGYRPSVLISRRSDSFKYLTMGADATSALHC